MLSPLRSSLYCRPAKLSSTFLASGISVAGVATCVMVRWNDACQLA